MPVGRLPLDINQEFLDTVETLASQGLNQQEIAACVGIHPCTLSDKKSENEQLEKALKRGRAKGIAHVTAQLLSNINDGNVTAQIFYLKTVAQWKEAREPLVTEKTETLMQQVIDKL